MQLPYYSCQRANYCSKLSNVRPSFQLLAVGNGYFQLLQAVTSYSKLTEIQSYQIKARKFKATNTSDRFTDVAAVRRCQFVDFSSFKVIMAVDSNALQRSSYLWIYLHQIKNFFHLHLILSVVKKHCAIQLCLTTNFFIKNQIHFDHTW